MKIRSEGIKVGDKVEIEGDNISRVLPRKNYIERLNAANIDCVNVVISPVPKPVFLLVDKMIALSVRSGCEVIVTVNKTDVDDGLSRYVSVNYLKAVDRIFYVSAKEKSGIDELKDYLKGKLVVFAGQSAVGKTSIMNEIFSLNEQTNGLSEKTGRGKHTTTRRKITVQGDFAAVDTPGFSSVNLTDIPSDSLSNFYKDFTEWNGRCYYIGCTHTNEPDCLIKAAVENGSISSERYLRYLALYKEIKEYEKRKY